MEISQNSQCQFNILIVGSELTWVRVGSGSELAWVRLGVGPSCRGSDLVWVRVGSKPFFKRASRQVRWGIAAMAASGRR